MVMEKRLIDANALMEKAHWIIRSDGTRVFAIHAEDVEDAPGVDAVEVVRCKDCKKAVRHEFFPNSRRCSVEDYKFPHKKTHFCSYGERRTE